MDKIWQGVDDYNLKALGIMGSFQTQTAGLEKQAFDQASARLDQFRQQRAAEAQALAQQTGGPVPLSAFTEGIDPGNIQPSSAAGALMGAIGAGQDQFADIGRTTSEVFPLIKVEQNKQLREDYEDKISAVQDEIANIKGQRGGMVNKRYADLLAAERDYQMAGATLGENVAARKAGNKLDRAKLTEQQREFNRQAAQEDARIKISSRTAKAKGTEQLNAQDLMDKLYNGGEYREYYSTSYVPVGFMNSFDAAQKGYILNPNPAGGKRVTDKNGNYMYYKIVNKKKSLQAQQGINPDTINPSTGQKWGVAAYGEIYRQLVGNGVPLNVAKQLVLIKYNLPANYAFPAVIAPPLPKYTPPKPGRKRSNRRGANRKTDANR